MPSRSAGLLLHRRGRADAATQVFVAHMGGPFWARKHEGAWSIPKGELDPGEDEWAAARREFAEEIGVDAPEGDVLDLGEVRYGSGKTVRVFAVGASGFEVAEVRSSEFELEWPPRSGRMQRFPEVDDARWADVDEARELLVKGQRPVLDRLLAALRASA